jgi:predicted MFS family arabinose efflux permease
LTFFFLMNMANDVLFVIYGTWLESGYGLTAAGLGLGVGVIGLAELFGEFMTAGLSDRIGLRRAVWLGQVGTIAAYALLPVLDRSLVLAAAGLFLVFLTVEFTIVCALSIFTELVPESRATTISAALASAGLGRVIGALIGGPIFLGRGIWATSLTAAGLSTAALVILAVSLRRWRPV